jgi:amino acid adenylation domain-containing protein
MSDLLKLLAANSIEHSTAAALGRPDGPFLDHAALHRLVLVMGETLRSVGVERGERIALCLPDALHAAVAFIAVATHAVCAPMNPRFRPVEIEFHLEDLAISVLVVAENEEHPALAVATRLGVQILHLACDEQGLPVALRADRIVPRRRTFVGASDQALLLHTSGTTARPKIVPLTQRNLVASSRNIARSLALTPRDRCLNVMPLFHIHGLVGALLASVAAGSSVALPRAFEPEYFFDWLDACQASWYTAVPPIHQAVLAMAPRFPAVLAQRQLRFIRSSSAALPPTLMAALERTFSAPVVEAYGMTEASHQVAINPLPPAIRKPGSVGVAAGPEVAIANEDGRFLPAEASGEICIRGDTVMSAYQHNDDANARAFHNGWLRTGDQGFFDAAGYLHISGRLKEMINRGGEKVSPLEVEAALLQHVAIAEAAVFAVPHPTLGEDVAAAVVLQAGATIGESELRRWLQGFLTDIKIPRQIITVDALPRGPTGKVQRRLLTELIHNQLRATFVAARTAIENTVADIWRGVLQVECIGVFDNFLTLGGDSLNAITMISRVRQALGIELTLTSLFERPVLAEFAETVRDATPSPLPPITATRRDQPSPLSFAQQRLWFLAQMEGVSNAYHVSLGLRLTGELDDGALRRALDRLIARHEALRTTFSSTDGQPVQRIGAADSHFELQEHDLRQHADAAAEWQRLANEEAHTAFDLETGPLIRGRLLRLGEREHVLLITLHHIVCDDWSIGALTREFGALYGAYRQGQPDPLPPLPIQYADYAAWQRHWLAGAVLQTQSDYWRRTLANAPALLELPTDRRRPVQQDYGGAFVSLTLDQDLTARLKALSQRHGATLFMTLLAGWAALLSRLSGQPEVVIGVPVANRGRAQIEPLIGFFVNSLAVRLDFTGSPTVSETLQRIKMRALEALQHQDLPFEQVVELLRPARNLSHTPVFQVMFDWRNFVAAAPELPGLTVEPVQAPQSLAKFDLTLELTEAGGCISGGLEYASALFDRSTIERHAEYLRRLLDGMAAGEARPIDRLPLLSDTDRHQLLVQWNDTAAEYPRHQCLHELVAAQATRTPDAVAIVYQDTQLTYAELNANANRLAQHLRMLGVKPYMLVAIGLERSIELVLAELAILKCGAGYVPLDSNAPLQRQAFILTDCRPQIVLTTKGRQLPAIPGLQRVDIDPLTLTGSAAIDPGRPVDTEATACVLYTSGSTGQPKGVVIPHRAIARLVLNNGYAHFQCSDRIAFAANPAFDASTLEVWAALLNGGCIVVIAQAVLLDPEAFSQQLQHHAVNVLFLPTGLFHQYADALGQLFTRLRYLMVGGDVVDPRIIARVLQRGAPQHLINAYGPTETTTMASAHEVREVAAATSIIPIGRPISNTQIYILDAHREPAPIGVVGEIHIGGAGVARGYLNRPELTAARFVADPFVGSSDARMYRSGDLGRYLANGTIEFLGRNDFQAKIRGFRIEPGEIEVQLARHPALLDALVLVRDEGGDKRLVAYYTMAPDSPAVGAQELRRHLLTTLPEYMLPAAYVRLDTFPLSANGKLDRKALPSPDHTAYVARGYEVPEGAIELQLARLWAELLKIERVGRHDNFFELGGHSFAALRLTARVSSTFGVTIGVAALFAAPTLREFAMRVSDSDRPREPWNIVQVQPLGSKTPVIAINNAMMYYDVAQRIGTDRRFLAVQLFDPGNPIPLPSRSLRQISADYVRLIREVQPNGPYILIGLCVAGLVAYEAGRQLRQAGERVALVVMADTWCPGYTFHPPFLQRIAFNFKRRFNYRRHTVALLLSGVIGIEEFLATTSLVKWHWLMVLMSALGLIQDPAALTEAPLEDRWFLPALERARNSYRPSMSTGDVVLLQSGVLPVANFVDPKMGWSDLVTGQLLHYRLPGWHDRIFHDKGAALIAQYLRPLLERVDAQAVTAGESPVKRTA